MRVQPSRGLTHTEARNRLSRHGDNVIDPVFFPGYLATFFKEIYEPTQLLLLAVGIFYTTFGDTMDALTSFSVIIIMAASEVNTEWRAKGALSSLKTAVPRRATVLREQQRILIPQAHVVPGDIVILKAGMEVPADLRLMEASFLELDESSATGESAPVLKAAHAILPVGASAQERINVVLAGSKVTRGIGRGVVYATGARTDAGNILKVARKQIKEKKTALQTLMKQVAEKLTIVALIVSAVGALLGLVKNMDWKHIILTALSLAFATIPEELPILIAAVLAVGARTLSKENIYVKQLRAAENLGYVDTVLADKTGTLTENRLTLDRVVVGSQAFGADSLKGAELLADAGQQSGAAASGPAGLVRLLEAWLHMSGVGDEQIGNNATEGPAHDPPPAPVLGQRKRSGGLSTPRAEDKDEDLEAPLLRADEDEGARPQSQLSGQATEDDMDPFDRAVLEAIGGMAVLALGSLTTVSGGRPTSEAAGAVQDFYRKKLASQLVSELPFDSATKSSSRMFRPPAPAPLPLAANTGAPASPVVRSHPPQQGAAGVSVFTGSVWSMSGDVHPGMAGGYQQPARASHRAEQSRRNPFGERTYFKGAPEALLASCQYYAQGDADVAPGDMRERMQEQIRALASQGLRLIGYAACEGTGRPVTPEGVEIRPASPALDLSGATFLGVLAFQDPIRAGATEAVRSCQAAGVHVVMVTGDHSETAVSVARQVGILPPKQGEGVDSQGEVVSCMDVRLEGMSEEQIDGVVSSAQVFARATPSDKSIILGSLRRQNRVILATGDGTNDAPVLAAADVGIAMGTSTDVAREACGIVILDDEFSSLVTALAEGRRLLSNLRKALAFYLGAKAGLVLLFVVATLYSGFPLAAIQILVLELFMDVGASSSFVMEPAEADTMTHPPRSLEVSFFDSEMLMDIATSALSMFAGVLSSFAYGLSYGHGTNSIYKPNHAQTMAFLGWLFGHVFLAFNMRSTSLPILLTHPFSNMGMNIWLLAAFITAALVAFVPFLQSALKIQTLPVHMWLAVIMLAFISTFWIEILKSLKMWKQPRSDQGTVRVITSEIEKAAKDIENAPQ